MSDDLLRRLDEWGAAKRLEYLPSLGRQAAARIRELEAERDALRADAERYRWLRDRHEYNIAASEIVQEVSGEGWDAAIDRALGEGK